LATSFDRLMLNLLNTFLNLVMPLFILIGCRREPSSTRASTIRVRPARRRKRTVGTVRGRKRCKTSGNSLCTSPDSVRINSSAGIPPNWTATRRRPRPRKSSTNATPYSPTTQSPSSTPPVRELINKTRRLSQLGRSNCQCCPEGAACIPRGQWRSTGMTAWGYWARISETA
jgi:hypothetical protein